MWQPKGRMLSSLVIMLQGFGSKTLKEIPELWDSQEASLAIKNISIWKPLLAPLALRSGPAPHSPRTSISPVCFPLPIHFPFSCPPTPSYSYTHTLDHFTGHPKQLSHKSNPSMSPPEVTLPPFLPPAKSQFSFLYSLWHLQPTW